MPPTTNPPLKLVSDRVRYLPPRNPIDSELGIIDATTLILLQKMMADSYEHGQVVWKENRERCAMTGEVESNDLPRGPNPAQKKVQSWLVDAGLLALDEEEESESEDEPITPPSSPETPRARPWHRRLSIVIPNKNKMASEPALLSLSPRSPLSPVKLWSAVQRGTSTISLPTLRLKPKHIPRPPSVQPAPPHDTLLTTALKRAALLRSITDEDVQEILQRQRKPLSSTAPQCSWYVPAHRPSFVSPEEETTTPSPPKKRKPSPLFDDPASYRWPAPTPPPPPRAVVLEEVKERAETNDSQWYHFFLLVVGWHLLIVAFCSFVVMRAFFRPLVGERRQVVLIRANNPSTKLRDEHRESGCMQVVEYYPPCWQKLLGRLGRDPAGFEL
ncbi:hypothetical protein DFH06DRAFT_1137964 [Mycena polygramma]|nr:hypothetical protein DFH06DRAFT_1137964 [Mycena polygramma]